MLKTLTLMIHSKGKKELKVILTKTKGMINTSIFTIDKG